ncbi:MAG: nicotinic acid mononucleotide adenylyltransferase [Alphaproteobacteria bacterium]|jgi:nicotinate-nucleotide adenylyltransferase|nr:nicotinic acid mononucleotide adenylyltransferase [Alphaproteobacteria bacterium]
MLPPNPLEDGARWRGARVGLFGGSFDPPHAGHRHVARAARAALALDAVWWLVSPQNPLKDRRASTLGARMQQVRAAISGQTRMVATDLEAYFGTRTTEGALRAILPRFPGAQFVWIGGMDTAASLHRWDRWQALLALLPTFYLTRPPAGSLVRRAPFRCLGGQRHVFLPNGQPRPPLVPGTTYWALTTPMVEASSTALRAGAGVL